MPIPKIETFKELMLFGFADKILGNNQNSY